MNSIIKKVEKAPDLPGVYTFLDKNGTIIYVGKALSLVKRLKSYFDSSLKAAKTIKMLELVKDVKYYVTNNETEALLLEASFIKTEKPRFNVRLKDAKGYPYIKLTSEDYPRILITRDTNDQDATYYGPFVVVGDLRNIIKDLQYIFPLRRCKNSKFKEHRVCLYYQIKQCSAPCENLISKEEYAKVVEEVKLFFKGETLKLEIKYENLMKEYAANLQFEKAAEYRDRLNALKKLFVRQSVVIENFKNIDIFYFSNSEFCSVTKMFMRNSNITGIDTEIFDEEKLVSHSEYVLNFYKNTNQIPDNIAFINYQDEFSTNDVIDALTRLKGKKVYERKKLSAGLFEILQKNNELYTKQYLEGRKGLGKIKDTLERIFGQNDIRFIECIDISHISGSYTVGASVCYDLLDMKFVKNRYRKYRIKDVENDDFKSIYQLMIRKIDKIKENKDEKSDLYIIDGGVGQLNAAINACLKENVEFNLISIAKGRSKSIDEKIEAEESPEYIFIPNRRNPLNFKKWDPFLLFVQKIRDEAHRFVIEYSRNLALKSVVSSNLLSFKGIGKKRAKQILTVYPDVNMMIEDGIDNASKKTGVPKSVLESVLENIVKEI
jgi:excinuclease ABC subunit C